MAMPHNNSRALALLLMVVVAIMGGSALAFVPAVTPAFGLTRQSLPFCSSRSSRSSNSKLYTSTPPEAEDDKPDESEGANLAAELFRMAQEKGIGVDDSDFMDSDEDDEEEEDEEEEDDEEDDEEEANYPQGAINAFLGYDANDPGEYLAGNVSLTNDQLYSEVKERVLDTAGGFVDFVKGAQDTDDDDEDEDSDEDEAFEEAGPKPYVPPTMVPDPELTAGEVVLLVLEALNNNDTPAPNRGVEILFGYSSPGSTIKTEKGLTPAEYFDFLKDSEYKVCFDHQSVVRTTDLCFTYLFMYLI